MLNFIILQSYLVIWESSREGVSLEIILFYEWKKTINEDKKQYLFE